MFYFDNATLLLITFLGDFLLRSLLKALVVKSKHTSENEKFDATLTQELRDEWLAMIQNWESDKSSPNPYTHNEKGNLVLPIEAVPTYSRSCSEQLF